MRLAAACLLVKQPYANHNGGCIVFGPDGYLYVGMGDGGSGGDPQKRAQNPGVLLGKMLRIDVGETGGGKRPVATYRIPPDNPFVGEQRLPPGDLGPRACRNPWRFSFDRRPATSGSGTSGKNAWEEIDYAPAGTGGQNFGWNIFEGTHPYPPGAPEPLDPSRFIMPVAEYPHPTGDSVTGGYVYRGSKNPALRASTSTGTSSPAGSGGFARGAAPETRQLAKTQLNIASFGEDAAGELYICDLRGTVYEISAKER